MAGPDKERSAAQRTQMHQFVAVLCSAAGGAAGICECGLASIGEFLNDGKVAALPPCGVFQKSGQCRHIAEQRVLLPLPEHGGRFESVYVNDERTKRREVSVQPIECGFIQFFLFASPSERPIARLSKMFRSGGAYVTYDAQPSVRRP